MAPLVVSAGVVALAAVLGVFAQIRFTAIIGGVVAVAISRVTTPDGALSGATPWFSVWRGRALVVTPAAVVGVVGDVHLAAVVVSVVAIPGVP